MTDNFIYELKERLKSGDIKIGKIKGTSHLLIVSISTEEWADIDLDEISEIDDIRKRLWEMSEIEWDEF